MSILDELKIERASRKGAKARIALAGPSGAGKTATALLIADTLNESGRTIVLDTEFGSASLYADDPIYPGGPNLDFDTHNWKKPPYSPVKLTEAIKELSGIYDSIIIDSFSAFWSDAGGLLEMVDAAGKSMKNPMVAWKDVGNPIHYELMRAILKADAHVIVCMRTKTHYDTERDSRGKMKMTRLGLAPVGKDSVVYDMTIAGDIDLNHNMNISKSRCSAVADRLFQPGPGTMEFAEDLAAWLGTNEAIEAEDSMTSEVQEVLDEVPEDDTEAEELCTDEEVDTLMRYLSTQTNVVKNEFVTKFKFTPKDLPKSQFADAKAWAEQLTSTSEKE